MKTNELFKTLRDHKDKALLFEYAPNLLVQANYHITEVKHIKIDSVDCGARTDAWNETIIQLWESPSEIGKTEFMNVDKALNILDRVGNLKAYDLNAEVKFEYSNATFNTAQLFVSDFDINNNQLIIKLAIHKTDCKAKDVCGVEEKELVETSCCEPSSGCC